MIPRPIFKILAAVLFLPCVAGVFWVWFQLAPEPQPYYLGIRSGFLYEWLYLPSLPTLPGSRPKSEQYKLLSYPCHIGSCLATPESFQAGKKVGVAVVYAPAATVRAMLAEQVYHGSVLRAMWAPLLAVPIVFLTFLIGAIVLDYRRQQRLMRGVQVIGRWPSSARQFSGWFGTRKDNFQIAVEKPDVEPSSFV